jgi:hypothetical protein
MGESVRFAALRVGRKKPGSVPECRALLQDTNPGRVMFPAHRLLPGGLAYAPTSTMMTTNVPASQTKGSRTKELFPQRRTE